MTHKGYHEILQDEADRLTAERKLANGRRCEAYDYYPPIPTEAPDGQEERTETKEGDG